MTVGQSAPIAYSMCHTGSSTEKLTASGSAQTRSRSYRHSFLVAYAQRIGERLDSSSALVTAEVRRDGRLLPVLAANSRATEELTERLFPSTVPRSVAVPNGAG